MGKRIILNLSDIKLRGNILDIGESYGVIYNISKEIDDELAIDFIDSEKEDIEVKEEYDVCTVFFYLSGITRDIEKVHLLKEAGKFVKKGGEILIWDINKERGETFNSNIAVILPSKKVKEFEFKNLNILSKSNIEDTKDIIKEDFEIKEEKLWEDIFFIRAVKNKSREEEENESFISSDKL